MKNKIKTMSPYTKNSLISYSLVTAAFILVNLLNMMGLVSSSLQGQLVPICAYIIMAVSLNLVVGISGELSLGHAGFMSVGAFTGIVVSGMLETSGLVYILHPYYNNLIKRAVKTPKLYFTDTGLCAHLLGITTAEAAIDSPLSGALLETFVLMDILKSHWYAGSDAKFWFYRDGDQREVDLILDYEGRLHPIEIKRAAMVRPGDVRSGLAAFRAIAGQRADMGSVVLISEAFGALDRETALVPVGAL